MPAVRFVDISYFVKSGQLFIIMFIYADQVARKSIFTNINLALAGQKVYSKSAKNTSKNTTLRNHHKVTISS